MSQNSKIAGLAIASLCLTPVSLGLSPTALAGSLEPSPLVTAQLTPATPPPLTQNLSGQCRALNRSTFIYNQRSQNSTRVRSLLTDERVRLADNGLNGWIAIDEPISGFVQTSDLKPCTDPLVGQCRAANRDTFIYENPSNSSIRVRSLLPDEEVVLASGGSEGWLAIGSPIQGYIQSVALKPCNSSNTPRNQPIVVANANVCHRVTEFAGEGLNVRLRPFVQARSIGVLIPGDLVRLRTNPPPSNIDPEGRTWLEVASPVPGWVSQGSTERRNLEPVTCP